MFQINVFCGSIRINEASFTLPEPQGMKTWEDIRILFKLSSEALSEKKIRHYTVVFQYAEKVLLKTGNLWTMLNCIAPRPDVSSGYDAEGQTVFNGGYKPLLAGEGVSVWHFDIPTRDMFADEDELWWWPQWMGRMTRGCQMALVLGQKLAVRWDERDPTWMGHLKDATLEPSAKTHKRLKSISTSEFPFRATFKDLKVGFVEDLVEKHPELRKVYTKQSLDGISFLDRAWFEEQLLGADRVLDMPSGYRKLKSPSKQETMRAVREANRRHDDFVRRARKSRMGSLRIVGPGDVGLIKGNALAVNNLFKRYGVHVLTSRWNEKREILGAGGDVWEVGYNPQYAHDTARTSVQYLMNLVSLFPVEQVTSWMDHDMAKIVKMLTNGELEEKYLLREDRLGDDPSEEEEGVKSVMFRHRLALEKLFLAGRGAHTAPSLAIEALKALVARMTDQRHKRLSVAIPHSVGHMQLLTKSVAEVLDSRTIDLQPGEIDIDLNRGYAVANDDEMEAILARAGGADNDDHFDFILFLDEEDQYRVTVLRHPNDRGEYSVLRPTCNTIKMMVEKQEKTVSSSFNEETRCFEFTHSDWEVRHVAMSEFPLPIDSSERRSLPITPEVLKEKTGIEGATITEKKSYPDGYTHEGVVNDIKEAREGLQPGAGMNIITAFSSAGYDRSYLVKMEEFIDLMTQGGSLLSKQSAQAFLEACWYNLLKILAAQPAGSRKIDKTYWAARRLPIPATLLEKGVTPEDVTSENEFTEMIDHLHAITKSHVESLSKWLASWQQQAPEWVRTKLTQPAEAEAFRKFTYSEDWVPNVNPLWDNLKAAGKRMEADPSVENREALDAARDVYAAAVGEFVARYGMVGLFARVMPSNKQPYNNDLFLWNGSIGDLIYDYFEADECSPEEKRERHGHFTLDLAHRLIHCDPFQVVAWINRSVDRGLLSQEDVEKIKKALLDHAGKEPGVDTLLTNAVEAITNGRLDHLLTPEQAQLYISRLYDRRCEAELVVYLLS